MSLLFTTSWDDGNALDVRIAELLESYNLRGTFYVLPQEGNGTLRKETIRAMSEKHEIGAHTLHHRNLPGIDKQEMMKELTGSKQWIEHVTGKPCTMFCYPRGFVNDEVKDAVKDAGFAGARTTEPLQFAMNDPCLLPTTLQVYPFPWRPRWKQWWHPLDPLGPLRAKWERLRALGTPLRACMGWLPLAQWLLTHAIETKQPCFHLWGHTKEIDRYNMWRDLESFLKFVSDQDIEAVTNGELITALLSPTSPPTSAGCVPL